MKTIGWGKSWGSADATRIRLSSSTSRRSNAERCLANGGNGGGLACNLDLRYCLSSEEIQQELARRSDEPSRRLASPASHSLGCPGPLELESDAA